MRLTNMSSVVAQRKAYLEMNYCLYVLCTLGYYAMIVLLSLVLTDIGTVFDFISAYAGSLQTFFIPALLYRNAVKKFGADTSDPEVSSRLGLCYVFYFLGTL